MYKLLILTIIYTCVICTYALAQNSKKRLSQIDFDNKESNEEKPKSTPSDPGMQLIEAITNESQVKGNNSSEELKEDLNKEEIVEDKKPVIKKRTGPFAPIE